MVPAWELRVMPRDGHLSGLDRWMRQQTDAGQGGRQASLVPGKAPGVRERGGEGRASREAVVTGSRSHRVILVGAEEPLQC